MTAIKVINLIVFVNALLCIKADQQLSLQESIMELKETTQTLIKAFDSTKYKLEQELNATKNQLNQLYFKHKDTSVPAGTVAYFANTYCAKGWLKANGQLVSRTSYKDLFSAIGTIYGYGDGSTTFQVPDLRGEFIRSWSDGRTVDTGRTFASFQWGSSIPFASEVDNRGDIASSFGWYEIRAFAGSVFDGGFYSDIKPYQTDFGMTFNGWNGLVPLRYIPTTKLGQITKYSLLQGTRPRNIALLACIKC